MGKNLTSFSTTLFCKKKKKKNRKNLRGTRSLVLLSFLSFQVGSVNTHARTPTHAEGERQTRTAERERARGGRRKSERKRDRRENGEQKRQPPPPPPPLPQPHRRSPPLLPRPPARALGRAPLQARVVPGRDLVRRRADRALAGLGARVLAGRAADGDARLRGRVAREAAHAAEQARGGADALADEGGVGGVVDGAVSTVFFFFFEEEEAR